MGFEIKNKKGKKNIIYALLFAHLPFQRKKVTPSYAKEPLMPSIRACLEYKHSYVRRNAVMAIFTIYKNFNFLMPDAPEIVANFLEREQDMSCKRNAFMMLIHADQERALNYLSGCIEQVNSFGDILQLVIVELIYKVGYSSPSFSAVQSD